MQPNSRQQIEAQYGINFHVPDRYQDLNVIGKGESTHDTCNKSSHDPNNN